MKGNREFNNTEASTKMPGIGAYNLNDILPEISTYLHQVFRLELSQILRCGNPEK
jgi:hypothetical protein